jgi:hypothetical protein
MAVRAALDYGISAVEFGEKRSPPVPPVLLTQARLAARNSVSLDTVLRRYFAGYTLLSDFLVQETEKIDHLKGTELQRVMRAPAAIFDRLIAAVTSEYTRELKSRPGSAEERRVERVRALLRGELIDSSDLAYELDASHLGAIAAGPGAERAIRDVSRLLDRRLLVVRAAEEMAWAWFGGRRRIDLDEFERVVAAIWPPQVSLAVGEPGEGSFGWRLTHQQAKAALPVALRSPKGFVRYSEVALLASVLQDDLLVTSLHEIYLAPLECERDGGATLRETLRAYFSAGRNISSASAALGLSRQTVTNHLRIVEQHLDRPLNACASDLEAALQLEALAGSLTVAGSSG